MPKTLLRVSEHDEQVAFMQWLQVCLPVVYEHTTAVPNQYTGRSNQMRLRVKEGLKKGYPDVLIDYPIAPWHGLRIEFKRADGIPSDVHGHQFQWIERLNRQGYYACVAWGCDDAIAIVRKYVRGEVAKQDVYARPPKR